MSVAPSWNLQLAPCFLLCRALAPMSEYDDSPEAQRRFERTKQRIAAWASDAAHCAPQFKSPFVPRSDVVLDDIYPARRRASSPQSLHSSRRSHGRSRTPPPRSRTVAPARSVGPARHEASDSRHVVRSPTTIVPLNDLYPERHRAYSPPPVHSSRHPHQGSRSAPQRPRTIAVAPSGDPAARQDTSVLRHAGRPRACTVEVRPDDSVSQAGLYRRARSHSPTHRARSHRMPVHERRHGSRHRSRSPSSSTRIPYAVSPPPPPQLQYAPTPAPRHAYPYAPVPPPPSVYIVYPHDRHVRIVYPEPHPQERHQRASFLARLFEKLCAESAGPFLSRTASSVLPLATPSRVMPVEGQLSSLVLQRAPSPDVQVCESHVALGADDDGGLVRLSPDRLNTTAPADGRKRGEAGSCRRSGAERVLPPSMSVLANELLLRMFAHLDRGTLRKVALANRTFSRLARSLLFSHFAASRYVTCSEKHKHDPVSASQLLQLSQCLDFWTSEEIAPLVRSCEISPWHWMADDHEQVAVPQLLATFFDHIERFAALRCLELWHIPLTGLAVSTLARLPMLSELTLQDCGVANGDSMPAVSNVLRLFHFSYRSERVEEWLPLLDPSCLRVLHTGAAPNNAAVIPVFPDVYDLVVCVNQPLTPADITFLQKFPGVTKLRTYQKYTNSPRPPLATLPTDVLPVLADFRGSFHALPVLLARDTLTRIETYEDSLDVFIMELQRLPAPLTNLIHLVATFGSSCTPTALEAIFTSFPRLEDVNLTFQNDRHDPAPAGMLSKLPSISGISSRLQRLSLIWICWDSVEPPTVDSIESDCNFPAVRAALMAQCPDLEFLWLDGRDFIYCWHTHADNTDETDVMATDPEDVEGVRFSWESLRQLP
ncbi:hypothetical protein GGX14DRAFT_571102 [Mycena pura]|uniref:F-box domain-containing protein n=1 Tax=Mycena pura TaxID=153505 RepID=A0AAD6Y6H7_9AGAR|nr:hypothetical protein GGX14DRAFT_571102 [Mycena pura]